MDGALPRGFFLLAVSVGHDAVEHDALQSTRRGVGQIRCDE